MQRPIAKLPKVHPEITEKKRCPKPLFLPKKKKCYLPSGYGKIAIENGPLIDDLPSGNLT
jgi:hypothetical protein